MEGPSVRAALARLSPEVKRWMFLLPIGTVIMLAGAAVLSFSLVTGHTDSGKIERITPAVILGVTLAAVGAATCAVPVIVVRVVVRRRARGIRAD